MAQRMTNSQRRVFSLFLATALATTGAFATTAGTAAAASTTIVPLTSSQTVQYPDLSSWLGSIQTGQTATTTLSNGYTLTASRVGGQKLITVRSSQSKPGTPHLVGATSICTYVVTAAIFALGASFFAAIAFLGWTVTLPFGIVIGPSMAAAISYVLATGGSIYGLVAAFLC